MCKPRLILLVCLLSLPRGWIANAQWVQTKSPPFAGVINCFGVSGRNLFAGTSGGGVALSTNNGTSWTSVNAGLTSAVVFAFAMSPTDSSGSGNLFAGISGGVFLSTNNGTSWIAVNTGLTNTYVWALALSPPDSSGSADLFA